MDKFLSIVRKKIANVTIIDIAELCMEYYSYNIDSRYPKNMINQYHKIYNEDENFREERDTRDTEIYERLNQGEHPQEDSEDEDEIDPPDEMEIGQLEEEKKQLQTEMDERKLKCIPLCKKHPKNFAEYENSNSFFEDKSIGELTLAEYKELSCCMFSLSFHEEILLYQQEYPDSDLEEIWDEYLSFMYPYVIGVYLLRNRKLNYLTPSMMFVYTLYPELILKYNLNMRHLCYINCCTIEMGYRAEELLKIKQPLYDYYGRGIYFRAEQVAAAYIDLYEGILSLSEFSTVIDLFDKSLVKDILLNLFSLSNKNIIICSVQNMDTEEIKIRYYTVETILDYQKIFEEIVEILLKKVGDIEISKTNYDILVENKLFLGYIGENKIRISAE